VTRWQEEVAHCKRRLPAHLALFHAGAGIQHGAGKLLHPPYSIFAAHGTRLRQPALRLGSYANLGAVAHSRTSRAFCNACAKPQSQFSISLTLW
jgi:hypothetical protein